MPYSLSLHNTFTMPFTFSHIAFAIPLKKVASNWFSASGLIAGSMLPDSEYYLRMTMYGTWGHSLLGVLCYELFIGICCLLVFHCLVKRPLLDNLPAYVKAKYLSSYQLNWLDYLQRHWFKVVASIYLGIGTHLFWDVFTHESGYIFGLSIPGLNQLIGGIPLYSWLQSVLSTIGLLALLCFIFRGHGLRFDHPRSPAISKSRFWLVALAIFGLVYALRIWMGIPEEKYWIQHMVVSVSAGIVGLIVASIDYLMRGSRVAA